MDPDPDTSKLRGIGLKRNHTMTHSREIDRVLSVETPNVDHKAGGYFAQRRHLRGRRLAHECISSVGHVRAELGDVVEWELKITDEGAVNHEEHF